MVLKEVKDVVQGFRKLEVAVDKFYNDKFYAYNDGAHGIDHVREVYSTAKSLKGRLRLDVDPKCLLLAVYTHDIFTGSDRPNHHTMARDYVRLRSDEFVSALTDDELLSVSQAVYYHRASVTVDTEIGDLAIVLRLADRGVPDLDKFMARATKSPGATVSSALHHINDKFGKDGYGFKDPLYREVYGWELQIFWGELDVMNDKLKKNNWRKYNAF